MRVSPICAQLRSMYLEIDMPILDELAEDVAPFRHITFDVSGFTDTAAERDKLAARAAQLLSVSRIEIHVRGEHLAQLPSPSVVDPEVAQGIAAAVTRLAQRLRERARD